MSRTIKDALIMAGAAGSVGLLVAGAEIGAPVIAGIAIAVAAAATIAKLAESSRDNKPTRSEEKHREHAGVA
jgi:hypothetical protein